MTEKMHKIRPISMSLCTFKTKICWEQHLLKAECDERVHHQFFYRLV